MTAKQSEVERSDLFKSLMRFYRLGAVLGVAFGAIHLFSILTEGFTAVRLGDALFNSLSGVWFFVCSSVLARGKRLVVPLHAAAVIASVVYAYAIGRGFNIIFALATAAILVGLIQLWRRGELE